MLFPLFVFLELSKRIVTTESFLTFISMEGKWNEIITSDKSKLIFNEETLWSSYQRCSAKKGVLGNFTKFIGKYLCQSLFFNKVGSEDLAQVFTSEFSEIFKNTFFTEHLRTTASEHLITCVPQNNTSRKYCKVYKAHL